MNVTPLRPKPTSELKATSLSTLVPSPIQPSPSLSLPPGMYYSVVDRNNPNMKLKLERHIPFLLSSKWPIPFYSFCIFKVSMKDVVEEIEETQI